MMAQLASHQFAPAIRSWTKTQPLLTPRLRQPCTTFTCNKGRRNDLLVSHRGGTRRLFFQRVSGALVSEWSRKGAIQGKAYFFTAASMLGPAFAKSSGVIAGMNSTFALAVKNHGSARAGIC